MELRREKGRGNSRRGKRGGRERRRSLRGRAHAGSFVYEGFKG